MEDQVDLQEKRMDEKAKTAYLQLKKHYSSEKHLLLKPKNTSGASLSKTVEFSSLLGSSKVKLSENALEMALILVNGFPELRSERANDNDYYWIYQETLSIASKRYEKFNDSYQKEALWNSEYKAVLEYLYGKEQVVHVEAVWTKITGLAYQKGYDRRSFRAPNLFSATRVNQLNFLIELNTELAYDLDMETYIIKDYALYSYGSSWRAHLWAAAIDAGNEKIYQLLLDIVYQRHPVGKVSRPIIKALLLSDKKEAWEAVKDLLLSAQGQEGLRQTILECLDETSLGAMKYLMEVILEHNLTRFSSVVRAVDTWVGLGWEGAKQSVIKRSLEAGAKYLNQPELIPVAIKEIDNTLVYMALWAQAVLDIEVCYPLMQALYAKGTIEKRCLALHFSNQTQIAELELEFAEQALEEENLKLLCLGLQSFDSHTLSGKYQVSDPHGLRIFKTIEQQLAHIPVKGKTFINVVFSWLAFEINPSMVHQVLLKLIDASKEEEVRLLLPYFPKMTVHNRERVTNRVLPTYYPYGNNHTDTLKTLTDFQRKFAFSILTDRGQLIRETGMNALKDAILSDEEVQEFEVLLKRKNAETRKSVIQLILKKDKAQIVASTERLVQSKSIDQRLAALDILNQIYSVEALNAWVIATAQKYQERLKLTESELILLKNITSTESTRQEYTWENGLGLYNTKNTTISQEPQPLKTGEYVEQTQKNAFGLSMPANKIEEALKELHVLIEKHQDYEYEVINWGGHKETVVLGNNFRQISNDLEEDATREARIQNYPLAKVWIDWYKNSKLSTCDLFLLEQNKNLSKEEDFLPKINELFEKYTYYPKIPKIGAYRWQNPIYKILDLLVYAFPYEHKVAYLKGLVAQLMTLVPKSDVRKAEIESTSWQTTITTWRNLDAFEIPYRAYVNQSFEFSEEEFRDYWALEFWCKSTLAKEAEVVGYFLPKLRDTARAYELNLITEDELYHRVLKPDAIRVLTERSKNTKDFKYMERFPFLEGILKKCRDRILEIELARGDSSTVVTALAQSLSAIYGSRNFIQIFRALGKENLNRGYVWSRSDYSKKQILSELLKICSPLETETQEDFNTLVKEAKLPEKRLIEAAVYAQQWIPFVSAYLKWKGLDAAIWWLHAHTNSCHTAETEIAKYSKVSIVDFQDGAVDTDWFKMAHKSMGKAKWKILYDAAKYISDGRGHKRAQLYADVVLGVTKISEVTKRVKDKRNQDYLRVYGLVPLSRANKEKDLLKRYQYLQLFKKESKQFGSQRQASEGLATRIAMDNLARTAGYSDPIRLTWAMEAAEAKQIMEKAEKLSFGVVEIYLSIDNKGKSSIICNKEGKTLSAIPAKLRKEKSVLELKAFNKTLRNQYTRTRKSLEDAMVNGDAFTKAEILNLLQHPVVEPMLKNLLVKTENQLGFVTGEGLKNIEGELSDLEDTIWIAHCSDIYERGHWAAYQRQCFEDKLVQPFKQIFRELYLPTTDELKEKTISRRYAGHQVQPNKTVALLKTRGWTVDYEEGLQKVYHKEGVIAKMYAMADWFSPADVESPSLETIEFFSRKTYKPVAFEDLEPRLFSEVMRDIDLVVSVAHVGGVDPEASHSTIEMRAVLVEETARLFKLKNVSTEKQHVYIEGSMGRYTVHLGSAVCHKIPGRYLSILPVHSQHRGHLFLPFVDEDPRSAELMSKVLLLAQDDKIQDPTVLSQIKDKVGRG